MLTIKSFYIQRRGLNPVSTNKSFPEMKLQAIDELNLGRRVTEFQIFAENVRSHLFRTLMPTDIMPD